VLRYYCTHILRTAYCKIQYFYFLRTTYVIIICNIKKSRIIVIKACTTNFIERKMRQYMAFKMPDRTSHTMEIAFEDAASQYPNCTFHIATTDRVKEFACYANLEAIHDVKLHFPNS
jgi:IS30 family transposase